MTPAWATAPSAMVVEVDVPAVLEGLAASVPLVFFDVVPLEAAETEGVVDEDVVETLGVLAELLLQPPRLNAAAPSTPTTNRNRFLDIRTSSGPAPIPH